MSKVLLTYGWVRSSYAVLRNLNQHGIDVHVGDSYRTGMCQQSRLKAGFSKYHSHYDSETEFLNDVVNIVEKNRISLIFPSHNETEVLAANRDVFSNSVGALLPDFEHCQILNNKASSYELARKVGLPVPRVISYCDPDDLEQKLLGAGVGEVVVKMLTGNSGKGVFYADSARAASELVSDLIKRFGLEPERYPQVEERIYGDGWGCSVLYWKGECVQSFCHRRIKEKIETGGTSTLRESLYNEALTALTKKLLDSMGWHGLAMVEFKVCPETGEIWFIEVNPRLWGSLPLAVTAGAEFPYTAYLCATQGVEAGKAFAESCNLKNGWVGRWVLGDVMTSLSELSRFEVRKSLKTAFHSKADSYDDIYLDDPMAFIGELTHYGSKALSSMSLNPAEKGMVR